MAALTEKAKLVVCNVCGQHVMAGKSMATLKPVVLDLTTLDVSAFLAVRAAKRKVYAIGTCGEIVGPLSSRDTYFPMNAWRPEHAHPWTQPEERTGSTRPPCETGEVPGAAPPVWCLRTPQERAGGATGCESCSPCPTEPSRSRTAALRASGESAAVLLLVRELGATVVQQIKHSDTWR